MNSNSVIILKIPNRQPLEHLPEDEILMMQEACAFLKLKRRTLYYHVERGSIPFLKAGRLIRFSRRALLDWMERNAATINKK
jgi:excisionase family DNA binding protein